MLDVKAPLVSLRTPLYLLDVCPSNERARLRGDEDSAFDSFIAPDLIHHIRKLCVHLSGQSVHLKGGKKLREQGACGVSR